MRFRAALFLIALLVALLPSGHPSARPEPPAEPKVLDEGAASLPPTYAPASGGDTLWFGGTRWDAADARWEALPDSVWTFETGVASAIDTDPGVKPVGLYRLMEGWEGRDENRLISSGRFRRISESEFGSDVCVGDATGVLGGDWSAWCGLTQVEADTACFAAGQGVGTNWNEAFAREFSYSGGTVQLQFSYVVETEPGFDNAWVEIDTTGDLSEPPVLVWMETGSLSGTAGVTLSPGTTLPSVPGPVVIRFRLKTDGLYDDEDGLYPTVCGGFAVDDVSLTGGIVHTTDFETGADGWERVPYEVGENDDWSDVQALADLGVVSGSDSCAMGDSLLTFIEGRPAYPYRGCYIRFSAVSPWIDLAEGGVDDATSYTVDLYGFFDLPRIEYVYLTVEVQWYLETCPETGFPVMSEFTSTGFVYIFDPPRCAIPGSPVRIDFSDVVPDSVEGVRVKVGFDNYNRGYFCDSGPTVQNTTPWIDAVRFGVVRGSATVSVGDGGRESRFLGAVTPNPWRGGSPARLPLVLERGGPVRAEVFDIAGRRVRVLVDELRPAGLHELFWDGRDDAGAAVVGSGVYFLRVVSAEGAATRKVVLLRD